MDLCAFPTKLRIITCFHHENGENDSIHFKTEHAQKSLGPKLDYREKPTKKSSDPSSATKNVMKSFFFFHSNLLPECDPNKYITCAQTTRSSAYHTGELQRIKHCRRGGQNFSSMLTANFLQFAQRCIQIAGAWLGSAAGCSRFVQRRTP